MANPELRRQVVNVYKGMVEAHAQMAPPWGCATDSQDPELLFLGREYPLGYQYFRDRLHRAFAGQAHLRDEEQIRKGIARAEFVKKGRSLTGYHLDLLWHADMV